MSNAAPATLTLPRILGPIRPRPRWREARLLAVVAVTILVGSVSLALAQRAPDAPPGGLEPAEPFHLAVYVGVLLLAHVAQVLAGRRTDQVLLPAVGLLGGISLLLMERLPQNLVIQTISSSGSSCRSASRRRSRSSCVRTAGCACTSTPGRPPAWPSCS